ncbi:hypothetical protein EJ04DRAFT_161860 [Polyplosphaeria fusca]|uniref:Uncharacterized protein n=1 Tax=Polyplosphaeria fusca TaxID=682080 RepID=A0A9P4V8I3_9PLEO|nr:hypothetical protein EJ04DRAFT_161860 [Polyplosphaeria fusca]
MPDEQMWAVRLSRAVFNMTTTATLESPQNRPFLPDCETCRTIIRDQDRVTHLHLGHARAHVAAHFRFRFRRRRVRVKQHLHVSLKRLSTPSVHAPRSNIFAVAASSEHLELQSMSPSGTAADPLISSATDHDRDSREAHHEDPDAGADADESDVVSAGLFIWTLEDVP